jgi:hypothetical protein
MGYWIELSAVALYRTTIFWASALLFPAMLWFQVLLAAKLSFQHVPHLAIGTHKTSQNIAKLCFQPRPFYE